MSGLPHPEIVTNSPHKKIQQTSGQPGFKTRVILTIGLGNRVVMIPSNQRYRNSGGSAENQTRDYFRQFSIPFNSSNSFNLTLSYVQTGIWSGPTAAPKRQPSRVFQPRTSQVCPFWTTLWNSLSPQVHATRRRFILGRWPRKREPRRRKHDWVIGGDLRVNQTCLASEPWRIFCFKSGILFHFTQEFRVLPDRFNLGIVFLFC